MTLAEFSEGAGVNATHPEFPISNPSRRNTIRQRLVLVNPSSASAVSARLGTNGSRREFESLLLLLSLCRSDKRRDLCLPHAVSRHGSSSAPFSQSFSSPCFFSFPPVLSGFGRDGSSWPSCSFRRRL